MDFLSARLSVSRRTFLAGAGLSFAASGFPSLAMEARARDLRFIFVILRGAMDGLSAVPPVGDPNYLDVRGPLSLPSTGEHAFLPLDGFFALHPSMPVFARLFGEKRALIVHATSTGYRDRSHFEGQNVLESGYSGPGHTDSGWLNRMIAEMPNMNEARMQGLAIGPMAPLVMRGPAPALGWAPNVYPRAGEEITAKVLDLYVHRDPVLANALRVGLMTAEIAARNNNSVDHIDPNNPRKQPGTARYLAAAVARLLLAPDGPRVAALAINGFDTHANEGAAAGLLASRLSDLDGVFEEFELGLSNYWANTVVVAVTEFGRTVRMNGTYGTDHGTGSVAFLCGGGVAGGRAIADWPGLKSNNLYEGRDLAPTIDVRAILKGVLADMFEISTKTLDETVFPDSSGVLARKGLVAL